MNSISPNLNLMIKACEKASKVIIRDFGEIENLQVSKKGPKDFVTNSDLKTEKVIIDELTKARPNYSFISEEKGKREMESQPVQAPKTAWPRSVSHSLRFLLIFHFYPRRSGASARTSMTKTSDNHGNGTEKSITLKAASGL